MVDFMPHLCRGKISKAEGIVILFRDLWNLASCKSSSNVGCINGEVINRCFLKLDTSVKGVFMSLNVRSMNNLLKKIFTKKPGLKVSLPNEEMAESLQKELEEKLSYYENAKIFNSRDSKRGYGFYGRNFTEKMELCIEYKEDNENDGYYYSFSYPDCFYIFFHDGEVYITSSRQEYPLNNTDQIIQLIEGIDSKRGDAKKRKQKREKVKKLKLKTIESRVKDLAKKFNFKYYFQRYDTKVKLSAKLDEDYGMEIDIPYSKFQNILNELESCIQDSKSLIEKGLNIKIKPMHYHSWISPE